ncbi:hypothetical protein H0G86_010924 [Trichoderma simmonsii]|uniref:Ankyrin repeat protein n=1 Tax=Trichoderma simmonsii TaxID=1491479 RepID=A0A8G0LQH9_9HYPO|nr:hypothetical protein H0G86_010924 [Trichoderma simmonsii]
MTLAEQREYIDNLDNGWFVIEESALTKPSNHRACRNNVYPYSWAKWVLLNALYPANKLNKHHNWAKNKFGNHHNDWDETPLGLAVQRCRQEVVRLFLDDDRVDPNGKHINGMTPLLVAGSSDELQSVHVIDMLLEDSRVDGHAQDDDGGNACMLAAKHDLFMWKSLEDAHDKALSQFIEKNPESEAGLIETKRRSYALETVFNGNPPPEDTDLLGVCQRFGIRWEDKQVYPNTKTQDLKLHQIADIGLIFENLVKGRIITSLLPTPHDTGDGDQRTTPEDVYTSVEDMMVYLKWLPTIAMKDNAPSVFPYRFSMTTG